MDPSYYFQGSQNSNLAHKFSAMNNPGLQNLKPGFTYNESDFYNYGQNMKNFDPQLDLFRNVSTGNYFEQPAQTDYSKSQNKEIKNQNPKGNNTIVDVWKFNLEEEFNKIMDLLDDYNLIALVTFNKNNTSSFFRIQSSLESLMDLIRLFFLFI